MPPRRAPPSFNTLSPDPPTPVSTPSSPAFLTFPQSRSTSPSGFTQFLSKPSKWFSRRDSNARSPSGTIEPRASTSSTGRKPKISQPTDPRPIVSTLQSDTYISGASRSVLDLSQVRPSLDASHSLGSPVGAGLGDLRNISRKGWSRSADDLSKISPSNFSPVDSTFPAKVAQYRSRSNSNFSTPSPSCMGPSTNQSRQPFPTIITSSPLSASPPSDSPLAISPGVAISVSAPAVDAQPQNLDQDHVHSRAHSFTPRLHSKLSAPKISFGPSSPKRKGSASSEQEVERDRDRMQRHLDRAPGASAGSGASGRAGFPFAFGGGSQNKPQPPAVNTGIPNNSQNTDTARSMTLLTPPAIIEPEQDIGNGDDAKRASQLLYHSGFINRLAVNPPPLHQPHSNPYGAPTFSLSKGWKPFKVELKGSKLYFYKPPGDRAAAVKELFPTECVPVEYNDEELEGDADGVDGGSSGGTRRRGSEREDGTVGRKKRTFWGRRTHPDLVLGDGVEKGTFEALVHEAVFATTSVNADQNQPEEGVDDDMRQTKWKDFASAILLCLPSLVGPAKFENEFLRCCSYLVSGAEEGVREAERARVAWLAGEYLRYHGKPVDTSAWDEWKTDTIPELLVHTLLETAPSSVSKSSSTQAIYAPSPLVDSSSDPNTSFMSPNVGMFSPRPDDGGKLQSLGAAFGDRPVKSATASPRRSSVNGLFQEHQPHSLLPAASRYNALWSVLEREGLSREVFLSLDPHLVARSLGEFHRGILKQTPENFTAEFLIGKDTPKSSTYPDHQASTTANATETTQSSAPLFGSEDSPHWLTKLVLTQVLGNDTSSGSLSTPHALTPGRTSEDRGVLTSRTHSRSEVISAWAKIGEFCRLAGDECSWRAIIAALCSRPVARLDKAWKRVDAHALSAVESWVHPGLDGEGAGIKEPRITPWGGDAKRRIEETLNSASGDESENGWRVRNFFQAREIFEGTRTSFSLCPRQTDVDASVADGVEKLVTFWHEASRGDTGMASKFTTIDNFMSLSFAAESRRKGLFEPFYWTRTIASSQPLCHPLAPLLFPEPLPTVTLVNREQIWRGRLESGPVGVQELRDLNAQLRLEPGPQRKRRSFNANDFSNGLTAGDLGGTVMHVFDGELTLIAQTGGEPSNSRPPSRVTSRPPSSVVDPATTEKTFSRSPSIRVKPGSSQGLDRKPSIARRNSLPSISTRPNITVTEPATERPLRVLVRAGTLDRLVDLLIHGLQGVVVSVADDNGEMPLREGKTRELAVDHVEFARVWWHVYRSFMTPFVFFELLRKRYINSCTMGLPLSIDDLLAAIAARSQVLETIMEWIQKGGGAQDALDDTQLFHAIQSFLDDANPDHMMPKTLDPDDSRANSALNRLKESRKFIALSFISQTMRPSTRVPASPRSAGPRTRYFGKEPPDIDRINAEDLVDNLDAMFAAAFGNVSEEDLFVTSDILEVQTADRTGWFLPRDPISTGEEVEIQTMYSQVSEVEPSHMILELGQDALYRLLPPGIRSCIRAYGILRKWLISKLVAFKLGLRVRQNRMDLFLRAIEVARLRNSGSASQPSVAAGDYHCVRSFVEAVLTSAVVSGESRMHQRAWQNVASSRGVQCDTLSALLSKSFAQATVPREALTVDMGWLLERMLEIISIPDIVNPSSEHGQSLVNFEKRRHLCNLVLSAPSLASRSRQRHDIDRRDFERLNTLEKEVTFLQFDSRGIKEEAYRESIQATITGPSSAKKASRPFYRLIVVQQEKNKRDRYLRDRLSREKKHEQQETYKREDHINKAMARPRGMTKQQKQHRNKKSMSSAFFQLMRPISSAFTSETLHAHPIKKTPAELDFAPSHKPSLVLSVADARVAQFINNERSYIFQLDTEDGGHYLLQAITKRDMSKWLDTINRVAKIAAKRRLTYLGNSPKPQLSDHIHNHVVTATQDPTAVFGVNLQVLLDREAGDGEVQHGVIPFVIERCLLEIEARGLSEVGIYRIAGATSEINALKEAFNRGESPITQASDIHAVCDLVKSWFRILPEPLFPSSSYYEVIEAMKLENLDGRLAQIRNVVQALPQPNFDLLKRVAEHLDKVTDYEEYNQMTAEALAIVFSPNLLRAPQNDFVMILANMGHTHKLVKALITHFHVIFDDVDPEAEIDQEEDEFDGPILEEDEEDNVSPAPSTPQSEGSP